MLPSPSSSSINTNGGNDLSPIKPTLYNPQGSSVFSSPDNSRQDSPSGNTNPSYIPKLGRVQQSSVYGISDRMGYSELPSRPNSAVDCWGKRKDLLKVAQASEKFMIKAKKLPARHKPPPPPPTPRLNEEQTREVDAFVQAYEKRTGEGVAFETPSDSYRRLLKNIEKMSKTIKRAELKKRNLHKRNLSDKELSQRLAIVYTKETRQKRLQEAQIDNDTKIIQIIRKEASAFGILKSKPSVLPRKANPAHYNTPRCVFMSLPTLSATYSTISPDVMENSIFILDAKREWVFPKPENCASKTFEGVNLRCHRDVRFIKCSEELKEIISFKEDAGLVFWFKDNNYKVEQKKKGKIVSSYCGYEKLSEWINKIQDPMDPNRFNFGHLKLEEFWWWRVSQNDAWKGLPYYGERKPEPRFVREIDKITSNFRNGGFEMSCVAELIAQSNPSLDVQPWFILPPKEKENSLGDGSKRKGKSRGTLVQRRKAKEKERDVEMKGLKEEGGRLEWEQEKGEMASVITMQSFVRGSLSRGGSRFEREGERGESYLEGLVRGGDSFDDLETKLFGVPPEAGKDENDENDVFVDGGGKIGTVEGTELVDGKTLQEMLDSEAERGIGAWH